MAGDTKRHFQCKRCRKACVAMPGDPATTCMDRGRCDARREHLENPPPLTPDPPETTTLASDPVGPTPDPEISPPPPTQDLSGSPERIRTAQQTLASRAVGLTTKILDKIEYALDHGVEVILKDGSTAMQQVAARDLAALARELRPILHEPVRAAEAKDENNRPLFDGRVFANPAVVEIAVAALHSRRERLRLAADRTIAVQPEESSDG